MNLDQVIEVFVGAAPVVVPLAVAFTHYLLDRLPAAKRAQVEDVVREAVNAAEGLYSRLPGSGEQKKAKAEELIAAGLKSRGIKVAPAEMERLIESFVSYLPHTAAPPNGVSSSGS